MGGMDQKFGMLVYPYHVQNWLDFGHGLWIFLILAPLCLHEINLEFPGIFWRMHGSNELKFGMLMYPDYLQNWLGFGHSLLILLISLWLD